MKNYDSKLVLLLISVGFILAGCASKKPVALTKMNEETVVRVPCADYNTDADFFRGQGIGQSKDLNTAREKARMAANAELAGSMQTWVKQFSERYVNDAGQSPADYNETFESLTRQKISEQINNISVACSETVRTSNGMYKVYLALEADRKEVFEVLDRRLAGDRQMKTLYDREKFRKLYNEEMESFKSDY